MAFATSDGAVTRGLAYLDIATMKNTAAPSAIRVKGNPNPVTEVRLPGTTVHKVLAKLGSSVSPLYPGYPLKALVEVTGDPV